MYLVHVSGCAHVRVCTGLQLCAHGLCVHVDTDMHTPCRCAQVCTFTCVPMYEPVHPCTHIHVCEHLWAVPVCGYTGVWVCRCDGCAGVSVSCSCARTWVCLCAAAPLSTYLCSHAALLVVLVCTGVHVCVAAPMCITVPVFVCDVECAAVPLCMVVPARAQVCTSVQLCVCVTLHMCLQQPLYERTHVPGCAAAPLDVSAYNSTETCTDVHTAYTQFTHTCAPLTAHTCAYSYSHRHTRVHTQNTHTHPVPHYAASYPGAHPEHLHPHTSHTCKHLYTSTSEL